MKPKLKPKDIEALPPGMHQIAPRLYLRREDRKTGTKRSVIMRWSRDGRAQVKSLGAWDRGRYGHYLAEAERAAEAQLLGRDVRLTLEQGSAPDTFKAAAEAYMAMNLPAFSSAQYRKQWRASMNALYPKIGHLKITQLEIGHVAEVLAADWLRIPAKARHVRRRIEQVITFAISRSDLHIANVASLDLLRHRLPKQPRRLVRHRRALPYGEVAACFEALGREWLASSEALRLIILTAARSSEVRLMKWPEVDFEQQLWVCPSSRMKNRKEWRVPLSSAALALLARMREFRRGDYVFPGQLPGKPLSLNVLGNAMNRLGFDAVPHGFRSSFKDWAREAGIQREHGWEAVELALAHDVQGEVERAYGRSDLLHVRRQIAERWAEFVTQRPASTRLSPRKMAA